MGVDDNGQTEAEAEAADVAPAENVAPAAAVATVAALAGAEDLAAAHAAPTSDAPGGEAEPPAPTIEDLELQVAALRQRVAESQDKVLRGAAEIENIRRRTAKEIDDAKKFGTERLLKDLLPVFDNFERALKHGKADDADPAAFITGVQMVLGQFSSALERSGVTAFASLGERFDPNLHEAIHSREADGVAPGTIVEEFQRGYKINNRLARPAMVIVATRAAPDTSKAAEAEPGQKAGTDVVELQIDAPEEAGEAGTGGLDLRDLKGEVEVIGATLADATGELLDAAGASWGAVITAVSELSPAARAGLASGDLVTHVGSRQVMDARAFKRAVQQSLPKKQPFTIVYRRGGQTLETKVGGR